jgi:mannan endo-1,4-beta-mannosidase
MERTGDILLQTPAEGQTGPTLARLGENPETALTWRLHVDSPGLYRVLAEVATPFGTKGYGLEVNGGVQSGYFLGPQELAARSCGLVELQAGENVLRLRRGWGHYDVDALRLEPAEPFAQPRPVPDTLSDPDANPAARALFTRLRESYGRTTLTGQYRTFGQSNFLEADKVAEITGRRPLIYGADLIAFSSLWVEHEPAPWALLDDMIAAGKAGHPVCLMWHWAVPPPPGIVYWKGFNTHPGEDAFNLPRALETGTPENRRLLEDLDAIAEVLRRFERAGVPVLWRPLHEPEGAWFWWGAHGPEAYRRLWRLTHERLVRHHGLHHLIWVYSPASQFNPSWYPGDDAVDIVAIDLYPDSPADALTQPWERLLAEFDGRKMLALGEIGAAPDLPRMWRAGVRWSFFISWTEGLGPASMPPARLREIYQDPHAEVFQ